MLDTADISECADRVRHRVTWRDVVITGDNPLGDLCAAIVRQAPDVAVLSVYRRGRLHLTVWNVHAAAARHERGLSIVGGGYGTRRR